MSDASDSKEVRPIERFSRVAIGLGKTLAVTTILSVFGANFAPSNETAILAAAAGFAIDVIRFLRDGGEQFMADMGIVSGAQKAASKKMAADLKIKEQEYINDRMNFGK